MRKEEWKTAKVIELDRLTPLPCATGAGDGGGCGRDAFVAYAFPAEVAGIDEAFPGHWLVLPVCSRCLSEIGRDFFEGE